MRLALLALAACVHQGGSATCDVEVELRDPSTGICQTMQCPAIGTLDWATCNGACDGLSEGQCLTTSGCHAAYVDHGSGQGASFWQCWDVPPSGPIEGACGGVDAHECTRYDNCTSIYYASVPSTDTTPAIPTRFEGCAPRTGGCANVDCGPGDYWVTQPPSTQCDCAARTSSGECPGQPVCGSPEPVCPPGSSPGVLNGCYTGYCILDFQCT